MKNLSALYRKILKICNLKWNDRVLLLEACVLTGFMRFLVLFIPFRKLVSITGKYAEESAFQTNEAERAFIQKVGWAVTSVSRYTPWESKCLVQALAAVIMLKTRNIAGTIYLGVAKGNGNKLIAHAWLRSGDVIITGVNEYKWFTEVARFSTCTGGTKG